MQLYLTTIGQGVTSDALGSSATAPSGSVQTVPASGTGTLPPQSQQGPGMGMLLPFVLVMVFMIGFTMLQSRREKKKRAAILDALKRGDKVLTVGGILAVVAEVRDDEVVLRIDENSNAKMRVTRAAIQQILKDGPADVVPSSAPQVEVRANLKDKLPA